MRWASVLKITESKSRVTPGRKERQSIDGGDMALLPVNQK